MDRDVSVLLPYDMYEHGNL